MTEAERAWMVAEVDRSLGGHPTPVGAVDPEGVDEPVWALEAFEFQRELKWYLVRQGWLRFADLGVAVGDKVFLAIAARGDVSWCCDPDCDRVLVGMPMSLFHVQGRVQVQIDQHGACFDRNLRAGRFRLVEQPVLGPGGRGGGGAG